MYCIKWEIIFNADLALRKIKDPRWTVLLPMKRDLWLIP